MSGLQSSRTFSSKRSVSNGQYLLRVYSDQFFIRLFPSDANYLQGDVRRGRFLTSFSVQQVQPLSTAAGLPKPEQWLGSITGSVPSPVPQVPVSPRRAPPLHARAHSLGSAAMSQASRGGPSDPFDVEWAEIAARNLRQSSTTNPFIMPNATQAFQVQL